MKARHLFVAFAFLVLAWLIVVPVPESWTVKYRALNLPLSPALSASYIPTVIKSIQSNNVAIAAGTTATRTVTSVDLTQSMLIPTGYSTDTAESNVATLDTGAVGKLTQTNATTITCDIGINQTTTCQFVLIEFRPGTLKSKQTGTIALAGATSNTLTITSVDITRSVVIHEGTLGNVAATYLTSAVTKNRCTLTNATTVTCSRTTSSADTNTAGVQAIEFR